MPAKLSNQSLVRRLIAVSTAAARAEEFEVAYHALMAALHAAELVRREVGSADALSEVTKVAEAQAAQIEKINPPHQLSRISSRARGNFSLYDTLQLHVKSARMRLDADRRRAATTFRWPKIATRGTSID